MGVTSGGASTEAGVAGVEEACLCCALRVMRAGTIAVAVLVLDTGMFEAGGELVTELER